MVDSDHLAFVAAREKRKSMPARISLCCLLVLLCTQQDGFSQSKEEIYRQGTDALYNLYFSTAEERFRTLTRMYPDDPIYWSSVASTLWLQIVADQQKLDMDSFSSASIGTENSKNTVSPEAEAKLKAAIDTTIQKADARLKMNKNDVQALYAKGIAKGALAAYQAVVKGSHFDAYSNARAARDLHTQVLKLDPAFKDASLTHGLYDYALGSLPKGLRLLLGLVFISGGDKEKGLATVADVAANGKRVAVDAKMLLVVMYNREKRYEDALNLVVELHNQFPKNYLLELSEAAFYSRLKKFDQSISTYNRILEKIGTGASGYERLESGKILLLIAKAYLDGDQPQKGIAMYSQIIRSKEVSTDDRGNAHLWLGRLDDVTGHREEAVSHYRAILDSDCAPKLKNEATKFLKKPFKW
jgi:tetratricopeptide (TPR) repeat protein